MSIPWTHEQHAAIAEMLSLIRRYPGEIAARRICIGKVCIAEGPDAGGDLPKRWVEDCRRRGLIAPARVRRMAHALQPRRGDTTGERWTYETGQSLEVMRMLVKAGDLGCKVQDLAGTADASGALEETLAGLYRGGLASPPAALWVAS